MTKHATWAKVWHLYWFLLGNYLVTPVLLSSFISFQHCYMFCLSSPLISSFPIPPSLFFLLGVKRAVKYINEFLAPALCNQVNTVCNNGMTYMPWSQLHEEWVCLWKLTLAGTNRCPQTYTEQFRAQFSPIVTALSVIAKKYFKRDMLIGLCSVGICAACSAWSSSVWVSHGLLVPCRCLKSCWAYQ